MTGIVAAVCGLFGLLVGSFLNVVIYRVPAGLSVVRPRSRCPECETPIAERDNIPVVSWLLLRGKCRQCQARISPRYPLVELLTAVLFAAIGARFGADWALPAYLVLTAGLVALSMIDLDTYLLPRQIIYVLGAAGVVLLGLATLLDGDLDKADRAKDAGLGAVIAFAILFTIHFISPGGMGFGDVRLSALLGLHLGWLDLWLVFVGLFLSFLLASVIGIGLMIAKLRGRKDRVPFGPFLALGTYITFFIGDWVVRNYPVP